MVVNGTKISLSEEIGVAINNWSGISQLECCNRSEFNATVIVMKLEI